jgi:iron complex outermembrane recepter protein
MGNMSYNNVSTNRSPDVFITVFNTPSWITNVFFGNWELTRNLGFNIAWKWKHSFQRESPLANGVIPAYHTVNAQVNYRVTEAKATVKLGGINIFNNRYMWSAAGPTIGTLNDVSFTFNGLLNK